MDHLKSLPDEVIKSLVDHCIPFREEFYECRIDDGERHDPITTPHSQLTHNAVRMLYANSACRQWQLIEELLGNLIRAGRRPTLNPDLIPRDPMVLRPRAMGKSLSTAAMLKTLAAAAVNVVAPVRPRAHQMELGDVKVTLTPPSLGSFFDTFRRRAEDIQYQFYDFHPKEVYNRPDSPNTTDYPLPRGGKRIPRHGEKDCRPSNKLLALIARSQ